MGLEATMILLDNSDWARNGDYQNNRWESQYDAANLVAQAKLQSNVESGVGLMTMAGTQVEVLLTPINDNMKFSSTLHGIQLRGKVNLKKSIQIAQLALKHRQNRNQSQRIIVFVSSPVQEREEELVKLGKQLKKNQIALDIINLGEDENVARLEKFVQSANNDENNSHFMYIRPSVQYVSDQLIGTPIMSENDMGGYGGADMGGAGGNIGGGGGQGGLDAYGGIDPNMDPELAMAIRISLEESKQKEELEKKAKENATKMEEEQSKDQGGAGGVKLEEEQKKDDNKMQEEHDEELNDEDLMKRAQELSLQDTNDQAKVKSEESQQENSALVNQVLEDKDFVANLVNMIPEMQGNPEMQKVLEDLAKKDEKDVKKEDKK